MFVASTTGDENAINFPLGTKPNYTDLQQLSFDSKPACAVAHQAFHAVSRVVLEKFGQRLGLTFNVFQPATTRTMIAPQVVRRMFATGYAGV
jgi:hypothetical protein